MPATSQPPHRARADALRRRAASTAATWLALVAAPAVARGDQPPVEPPAEPVVAPVEPPAEPAAGTAGATTAAAPSPTGAPALSTAAGPLRIALECQRSGRTRACPAYLRGIVEHTPVLLLSPRATAQVVLYVNATDVATIDRLQLRFVGDVEGAPREVETVVALDTLAGDDAQVAALYGAFARGVALYVAALHPEAVAVTFQELAPTAVAPADTTPWSFAVNLGGYGSWTRGYQSGSTWASAEASWVTRRAQVNTGAGISGGVSRQPPLVTETGEEISLDTAQYGIEGGGGGVLLLDEHWSVAAGLGLEHQDAQGQFDLRVEALAGIAWDRYAVDDPRGNRLEVAYRVGLEHARYNFENELGERVATFPVHSLAVAGSVRDDRLEYGLSMLARAEVVRPDRRYTVTASPYVSVQLGRHVDLSLSVSATTRELPAPVIDPSDFEQLTRASYAEPFGLSGSLNLRLHWDRTNGQRNDRFQNLDG